MPITMDVTDATFETDVLDRSTQTTVVVDLWASWCGPCRVLGPILEKVVGESPDVELVKVDVDANPRTAATFRVQSIPAVYAIRDRKVVDSFVGALPEPAVRQWVASLAPAPSEVDRLIAAGDEAVAASGRGAGARQRAGRSGPGPPPGGTSAPSRRGRRRWLCSPGCLRRPKLVTWRPRPASGAVSAPAATGWPRTATGVEAKLDALLDKVREDEAARQEFLDLLEVLGPDDPRTATYRKALTARLF